MNKHSFQGSNLHYGLTFEQQLKNSLNLTDNLEDQHSKSGRIRLSSAVQNIRDKSFLKIQTLL